MGEGVTIPAVNDREKRDQAIRDALLSEDEDAGKLLVKVAAQFGVSAETVRKIAWEQGLERRTRWGVRSGKAARAPHGGV